MVRWAADNECIIIDDSDEDLRLGGDHAAALGLSAGPELLIFETVCSSLLRSVAIASPHRALLKQAPDTAKIPCTGCSTMSFCCAGHEQGTPPCPQQAHAHRAAAGTDVGLEGCGVAMMTVSLHACEWSSLL